MILVSATGKYAADLYMSASRMTAYVVAVLRLSLDRRHWTRDVRSVLTSQIYFSGVVAMRLLLFMAFFAGAAVVTQVQLWLTTIGQSALLGGVLVTLVIREVGPLLVGFVLIGRSGTAICAELAGMRSRGEIHVLEAQGVDPIIYLVLPRAIALSIANFGLTLFFASVALSSGWIIGALTGLTDTSFLHFMNAMFLAIGPMDIVAVAVKGVVGGLLIGTICCVEGLATSGLSTEIPQAVTKGVIVSMATLLAVYALVSLLTYIWK